MSKNMISQKSNFSKNLKKTQDAEKKPSKKLRKNYTVSMGVHRGENLIL